VLLGKNINYLYQQGRKDECSTAADMYQCVRDLNPPVTDKIFDLELGNGTVVKYAKYSLLA
jgi:hypothetical protein